MVTKKVWNALYKTKHLEIPFETMQTIIESYQQDAQIEDELIRRLCKAIDDIDDADDMAIWWLIVISGETRCEKAIPALIRCFDIEDADIIYELAEWALLRIGENGVRAAMDWIETDPPWEIRICGYSILENALSFASPAFRDEIIAFLKKRIGREEALEELDQEKSAMDTALQVLAYAGGKEVLPFIREVVSSYEYDTEFDAALQIAEGRYKYPPHNLLADNWEEVCRKYMGMAYPPEEKKYGHSDKLLRQAERHMKSGQLDKAEASLKQLKEHQDRHWDGPEKLADIYEKQGRLTEAQTEIQEALKRIHSEWHLVPAAIDYEIVEEIEQKADRLLGRDTTVQLGRLADYLLGMLTPLGVLQFDAAMQELRRIISIPSTDDQVLSFLKDDARFSVQDDVIALAGADIQKILETRAKRNIEPRFRYSLSGHKLLAEGRPEEIYGDWAKQADQDIRILTRGKWTLDMVRKEIQKDVEGMTNTNQVIAKMVVFEEHLQELNGIVMNAWNKTPRWELAGRTAEEVRAEYSDRPISPHVFVAEFKKPGRNDPCPCGSGKKYKKCCGAGNK